MFNNKIDSNPETLQPLKVGCRMAPARGTAVITAPVAADRN